MPNPIFHKLWYQPKKYKFFNNITVGSEQLEMTQLVLDKEEGFSKLF